MLDGIGLTILCVSRPSAAQVTRNLILERAGYRVLATDDPREAERIFSGGGVNAVVFGETKAQQGIELGASFKRMNPSIPIVFLYKMNGFRVPPAIADDQVEFLGAPGLLLQALDRVLGRAGAEPAEE
jgi:DNA-binding NtrC family response regulator